MGKKPHSAYDRPTYQAPFDPATGSGSTRAESRGDGFDDDIKCLSRLSGPRAPHVEDLLFVHARIRQPCIALQKLNELWRSANEGLHRHRVRTRPRPAPHGTAGQQIYGRLVFRIDSEGLHDVRSLRRIDAIDEHDVGITKEDFPVLNPCLPRRRVEAYRQIHSALRNPLAAHRGAGSASHGTALTTS